MIAPVSRIVGRYGARRVEVVLELPDIDGELEMPARRPLPLRLDLADLAPCGFTWGIASPGTLQLALAIAAYVMAIEPGVSRSDAGKRALAVYMDLAVVLARVLTWHRNWSLPLKTLRAMVLSLEGEPR